MSITLDCQQGISVAILLLIEVHSKRVDTISKTRKPAWENKKEHTQIKYQFVFPVCPKLWSTEKLPLVTLLHNNKLE